MVEAVDETVLWCFDYFENKRALPTLTPIRLAVGESRQMDIAELVFVMSGTAGSITGPCTYAVETAETITASTPFYAFVIGGPKTPAQ